MKRRIACLVLAALVCALSFALAACGNKISEPPVVKDPALEYYSQKQHIGWQNSLDNFSDGLFEDYVKDGEPAFIVPGLNEGENFVVQGVAFCEEKNWALLSGYIKPATEHPNSVLFILDMSVNALVDDVKFAGALIKEVLLDKPDGTPFTGHVGGVAASKNNVWLSNGGKLYYIPIADLAAAEATSHIALKNSVEVPVEASYTSYADGILWVGEFEYARDDYVTDATHHSASDKNLTAWTVGYRLDESGVEGFDAQTGIKSENLKDVAIPDVALWHGEKVQGMVAASMADGSLKVALSKSYGRSSFSQLVIHEVRGEADLSVEIAGQSVPCFVLKDGVNIIAPPMLEDLALMTEGKNRYLLLASESGSYNYYGAETSWALCPTDMVWKYKFA